MKIFVTGVAGQLGHDVMNELAQTRASKALEATSRRFTAESHDGSAVTAMPYVSLDITRCQMPSEEALERRYRPDAVIHCAAWTAVDAAEDEDKQEKVRLVNVVGTDNIAKVCKEAEHQNDVHFHRLRV